MFSKRVGLYRIDLAAVVSRWLGESEKRLDRVFTAAELVVAIEKEIP